MFIDDPDYAAAIKMLAAALAKFDPELVYAELEEESGVTLLLDLNAAIAEHHPALYAKLRELLAA